jgi:hypothetical protein
MVSNEFLESELDGLANVPTATDLGYEDSELHIVLNNQNGLIEFEPEKSPESDEAWLRINTESFVFNLEEWH